MQMADPAEHWIV